METFIESFSAGVDAVDSFVWGWALIWLLLGTHLFMTIRTGFIQRKIPTAIKLSVSKNDPYAEGDISQFGALTTALAATIGTGTIVGVATGLLCGGPGAIFWMWLTGVFGIATKYSETYISMKYRVKDANGRMLGGAMYALERGFKHKGLGKLLAVLFALFTAIASFGIGASVQSNSLAGALTSSSLIPGASEIPTWLIGIVVTVLVAIVIIGGLKKVSKVCEKLVPVMAIFYVACCLVIIGMNGAYLWDAIVTIITCAFTGQAAFGGAVGSGIMLALQYGFKRGLFSNESGLGSAPIAAAAARTSQPVVQALISMTQTFIDTLVVCSMTGLVILVTGVWTSGKNGAPLTSYAFETGLPGELGGLIVTIGIILFAYSTILGWSYYGEKAIEYLLGSKAIIPYRWAFIISVGLGASMKLDLVWTLSDIFNALMAFPNLIGLIMLTPVVKAETLAYLRSLKKEPASEG